MGSRSGTPAVSVIIPTYNRCALLRETLASLVDQRLPAGELEVVVADDGSSDATRAVVDTFAGQLPLRYVFQPDEGFRAGQARNAGAALATAPVLVFLDTGVVAGPDFARHHRDAHADGPPRVVLGYTYGYNPDDPDPGVAAVLAEGRPERVVARHGGRPEFRDARHEALGALGYDLSGLAAPWYFGWTLNYSVPTADFRAVGGFDEDFRGWGVEDVELTYRLSRHGLTTRMSRDAWAIEMPHERDSAGHADSTRENSLIFLHKHPDPLVEIYWGLFLRVGDATLEQEHHELEAAYRELLRWTGQARELGVRDELAAATADLPGTASVVAFGCGDELPAAWARPVAVVDFDAALLAGAARHADAPAHLGIGVRTPLPDGAADVVVVSSRLRGLWDRWGEGVLAEARRVGREVRVPFLERVV